MGLLNPFKGDAPKGKPVRSLFVPLLVVIAVLAVVLGVLSLRASPTATPLSASTSWPTAIPSVGPGPRGLQYLNYIRAKLPGQAYDRISGWLETRAGTGYIEVSFPLSATGPRAAGSWPRIVRQVRERGYSLGKATFAGNPYRYVAFRVSDDQGFIVYEPR
jgi:hypothetical protein